MKLRFIVETGTIKDVIFEDCDGSELITNMTLKEVLETYFVIENPAKSFAERMKAGAYENVSDFTIIPEAEAIDKISDYWKLDGNDMEPKLNVLMLLRNMCMKLK